MQLLLLLLLCLLLLLITFVRQRFFITTSALVGKRFKFHFFIRFFFKLFFKQMISSSILKLSLSPQEITFALRLSSSSRICGMLRMHPWKIQRRWRIIPSCRRVIIRIFLGLFAHSITLSEMRVVFNKDVLFLILAIRLYFVFFLSSQNCKSLIPPLIRKFRRLLF